MQPQYNVPQYSDDHYAVVDLGSNSFHLLIARIVNNEVVVVDKIKRKVRLASGLNKQHQLSEAIISDGLDCLKIFSQYLSSVPLQNISIVATATLRIAINRDEFLTKANKILPLPINLLSGKQEAATIFNGVAHTSNNHKKRLVIDIGGASTEIIVGKGFEAQHSVSLNIGCVSFNKNYFIGGMLTPEHFKDAIEAAHEIIEPVANDFIALGWEISVGSSGTMQALMEILQHRECPLAITHSFLIELQQEMVTFNSISNVQFDGLRADRVAVLASGLCILIALFECLSIESLCLSKGALREGLLFSMLPTTLPE